jgi:hypothetical protein
MARDKNLPAETTEPGESFLRLTAYRMDARAAEIEAGDGGEFLN